MFARRESKVVGSNEVSIIEEGTIVEGQIYSKGPIIINGIVRGEVISEKDLIIGREGKVNANVKTSTSKISGRFNGEMIVSGEVELTATGRFVGNLTQKGTLLTIQKGALLKGQIIVADNQNIDKPQVPEPPKALQEQKPALSLIQTPLNQKTYDIRNPVSAKSEQSVNIKI